MNRPELPSCAKRDTKAAIHSRPRRRHRMWLAHAIVLISIPMQYAAAWPISIQRPMWLKQPQDQVLFAALSIMALALSSWALISRLRRSRTARKNRSSADLWPELVHATAGARTLDGLLRAAAGVLIKYFHTEDAWLAKYSARLDRWFPLPIFAPGYTHGEAIRPEEFHPALRRIVGERTLTVFIERAALQSAHRSPRWWLVIPIGTNRKPLVALALSWKSLRADDAHVLATMEPVREFLSRNVADLVSSAAADAVRTSATAGDALAQQLGRHTAVESALATIAEFLWRICRFDYVALSGIDRKSRQEVRWSALIEQGRVIERQYPILAGDGGNATPPQHRKQAFIAVDLAADPLSVGSVESRLGMRAQLTLPLVWAGKTLGKLTLAHRQPGQFDDVTLVRLEPLARVLAEWLQIRQAERLAERTDRYLDVLDRLDRAQDDDRDTITGLVRQAMDVTAVRLFRYDAAEETFHLTGSAFARPVGERGGLHLHAPAKRLPWLRFALREDRPCLIDQNDPERSMSVEESRLAMLERFKSGLLMPLRFNQQSVGLLGAVEMRHPARRRFEGADYIFLRCAASRIAGLMSGEAAQSTKREERPSSQLVAPLLAAPLTTIYGSVDLIRQNLGDVDGHTARYLSNIERAAERIKEFGCETQAVTFPKA